HYISEEAPHESAGLFYVCIILRLRYVPLTLSPFKLKHFHFPHETSTSHNDQANVGHPDV
uniref:hypothetical protein n=1 Tax=Pantoea eucalypti TaxID=470933 RepID=UPI0028A0E680